MLNLVTNIVNLCILDLIMQELFFTLTKNTKNLFLIRKDGI